jgi:hypothetical protein
MYAKTMKSDAKCLGESFKQVFTNYLNGFKASTQVVGGTVMDEIWCCPGKTGVIGLILCLYWQAEFSGVRNDWKANIKLVENILNAILAEPDL